MKTEIIVVGHGSKDPEALIEFELTVKLMQERLAKSQTALADFESTELKISAAYLEFAKPDISEAVDHAIAEKAGRIIIVPALLMAATHAKNDMPAELAALRVRHPNIEIKFAAAMDLHPNLLQLCQERIIAAEANTTKIIPRSDTCLVLVGRGTSDSDVNADISKLARMLEEGMGFGASYVCFTGTASPLTETGLEEATKLGKKRLLVMPYLLFTGVLYKRVITACSSMSQKWQKRKNAQSDFLMPELLLANYLGPDQKVADVFLERSLEGHLGKAHMNCSLCKYRVQVVGYENQVGQPQVSHHKKIAQIESATAASLKPKPYTPHPIESESFRLIAAARDWSNVPPDLLYIAQRLAHTSGDLNAADDLFVSPGAPAIGSKALLRCRRIVCDVSMVQSGLKRLLIDQLEISTWCGVHDRETALRAEAESRKGAQVTLSAMGIRRAWELFGNDLVLAIGDAPTAVMETIRLIREFNWRPQLVIALPVGFVGTRECKEELKQTFQISRITNSGTRGGSPWAACVVNALMINAVNGLTEPSNEKILQ